jgi:hypothetical protein
VVGVQEPFGANHVLTEQGVTGNFAVQQEMTENAVTRAFAANTLVPKGQGCHLQPAGRGFESLSAHLSEPGRRGRIPELLAVGPRAAAPTASFTRWLSAGPS